MVGPVFVGLLLAGFGVMRVMYLDMMLHEAVLEASRYGSTGMSSQLGNSTRMSNITTIMQNITGITTVASGNGSGGANSIVLTITPYQDWPSLDNGTAASTTYGPAGDQNNVVVYSASYSDTLTNSLLAIVAAPQVTLTESTVVQNEHSFSPIQGFQ